LYTLLESWPTPSETAETLLVQRDGDDVLFLNHLRYRPDAALNLRIPLSQTDSPAVMAVLGKTGVVQGTDYRGTAVLAVLQPIPDSPWFLVAKMDTAEALAEWRLFSGLLLALLLGFVILTGAALLAVWQRSRRVHYQTLYESEAARRASEERYRVVLKSIGDAVIAADAAGCVELLNPVAEALTGWTDQEARGQPLDQVFAIVDEETRQPAESPLA
jgi:two-component system cell cycle sensor histidine kinase/response regulator CckA